MIKLHFFKFIFLVAVVLVSLDLLFSTLSNKRIQDGNFFFDQRVKDVTLGSGYYEGTYCQFDTAYLFYTYKTCLIRHSQRGVEDWSYRFVYARPFPISLSFMNKSRFEMMGTRAAKYIIFSNGIIKKGP
jgi:hypothetical protein